jgi:hypothetical protein
MPEKRLNMNVDVSPLENCSIRLGYTLTGRQARNADYVRLDRHIDLIDI